MYVTLRDLFWIQSVIPFQLRQQINTILSESDADMIKVLRNLLTNSKTATQIALIVLVVELSIEHPDREVALLKAAENLMMRPNQYRKLIQDFRYRLLKTMDWTFRKKVVVEEEEEEEKKEESFYI